MKHFTLSLGESRFALCLDPACAELLGAFYPDAGRNDGLMDGKAHRLRVRRTEQGFEIETEASPDDASACQRFGHPASAMLALEEVIERLVIAEVRDLVALHGGAVSTPAGTCLLLGNSESGKSSTTFQLAELGLPCLCEEITLYEPSSRRVLPHAQTLSLSESMVTEFAADFPIRGRLHRLLPSIVRYQPLEWGDARNQASVVSRILLPRFEPGADTRFTSMGAAEALPEVLGYSFEPNVETEALFDRMIELLERVETFRFVYSSAASARAALSDLFLV